MGERKQPVEAPAVAKPPPPPPPPAKKIATSTSSPGGCWFCLDPDGASCFPHYGRAGWMDHDETGFVPDDPDDPQSLGMYRWCPYCKGPK